MIKDLNQMGKYMMTIILEDSKQLQAYRYGQNDDSK